MARAVLVSLVAITALDCATVAQVELNDPVCEADFQDQMASILIQEGEKLDDAQAMAHRASLEVSYGDVGVRPFSIGSRTTDYTFFVQKKKSGCMLRLVSRQKGFTLYTNDITYIAMRPVAPCDE